MPHARVFTIIVGAALVIGQAAPSLAAPRDRFYWMSQINRASAVMIAERGIVPKPLAAKIHDAIVTVDAAGDQPGAPRSGDYLKVEQDLMAAGGPDISRLHSGRSRQDIGSTTQRLITRDDFLTAFEKLNGLRDALLSLAAQNPNAIIPAYTWGVQAQPITFGHYLSAYAAALEREATRMREAYVRLNQSPLGAAALGTSSFPVDRPRLAELLGFGAVAENSLDANQISPIDGGAELAGLATSGSLTLGALIADVTTQYAQSEPWILLAEGAETGISSIMPQKRNPAGLVRLRAEASNLIGEATTFTFIAHNVEAGMSDYKDFGNPKEYPNALLRDMAGLFAHGEAVIRSMRFRPERALDEVNGDYSTTTELADVLQREADVPFRIGHHFASDLVNYGRGHHLRASQIPFAEAQRIYAEVATTAKVDTKLPLSEQQFRRALTPENMVSSSKGLGGPQASEVARMLATASDHLAADRAWLDATRAKLTAASQKLDQAFAALKDAK
ncbi:argininosuccinate lyase [Bradyrhizobium macuxiense]|uniref:argininosuccinate lyase n=1 Tax=Bradyrhizobium macuxiense TaxID=1755647 RepID=UPI000A9FEAEB|nr:argininosuccinate lyase [Bradyrhizobium macuxiense]